MNKLLICLRIAPQRTPSPVGKGMSSRTTDCQDAENVIFGMDLVHKTKYVEQIIFPGPLINRGGISRPSVKTANTHTVVNGRVNAISKRCANTIASLAPSPFDHSCIDKSPVFRAETELGHPGFSYPVQY